MIKKTDEKSEIRKFGFGLTVLLCIFGGWQLYKGNHILYPCFFGPAALVLILSLFATIILKPVYKLLTTIAHAIGWVNTRIILGIIFYTIFTSIGVFLRIVRKDLLNLRIDKDADTYWIKKNKVAFDKELYEKQF